MGCLKTAFLLLMLAAAFNGMAQDGDKTPDTTTSQTTVPDTVVLRSVPDTAVARYKKDKDFEYANDPAYWKTDEVVPDERPNDLPHTGKSWSLSLRMLVFLVITGSLFLLLYWQFFSKASRRMGKASSDGGAGVEDEGFDGRIRDAMQVKDYRMATRYLFLKALHMLHQQQLIHYQAKATNREYVLQMSAHRAGARFGFLADAYDHVWYGDFLLSEEQFGRLFGYFEDFYRTLSHES